MSGTDRLDQSASQPDPISDEERERMGREAAARKQLASVCYEQAREACDELRYQLEQMRRAESDRLVPRYFCAHCNRNVSGHHDCDRDPNSNPHPEYQQGQPRADGPDLSVKIETRDNPFLGQPHADEPEPGQAQRAGALYDGLDDLAVALQTGLGLVGLTHMNLRHGARAVLEKAGVEKLLDELEDLRSDVASDNAEFDAIATSLGIRDAKGGYETDKLAPHVKQLKARAEKAERELTRVNEEREHYREKRFEAERERDEWKERSWAAHNRHVAAEARAGDLSRKLSALEKVVAAARHMATQYRAVWVDNVESRPSHEPASLVEFRAALDAAKQDSAPAATAAADSSDADGKTAGRTETAGSGATSPDPLTALQARVDQLETGLGWLEAQIRWDLRELCEISIQLVSQSAIARWEREQYTERLYAIRDRNKPEGG